jgi:hypothetical protein
MYYELEYDYVMEDGVAFMVIGYTWTPVVHATITRPEEGGLEVDRITCKDIAFYSGKAATPKDCEFVERWFPTFRAFWLAHGHYQHQGDDSWQNS